MCVSSVLIYFVNKIQQRIMKLLFIYRFNYTAEDITVSVTELLNYDNTDFFTAFEIKTKN